LGLRALTPPGILTTAENAPSQRDASSRKSGRRTIRVGCSFTSIPLSSYRHTTLVSGPRDVRGHRRRGSRAEKGRVNETLARLPYPKEGRSGAEFRRSYRTRVDFMMREYDKETTAARRRWCYDLLLDTSRRKFAGYAPSTSWTSISNVTVGSGCKSVEFLFAPSSCCNSSEVDGRPRERSKVYKSSPVFSQRGLPSTGLY
jgi:hypothetical protein